MEKRICINEDNGHFYSSRRPEELTEGCIAGLVDTYAADTQVGQILFCVNVQKALFDSAVWEPVFAGYDPDGPDDQPLLRWLAPEQRRLDTVNEGRRQVHNIWLMTQKGLDHFAIWLNQCRKRSVEGWLTVRMNDCHWVDNPDSHWHSSFWKDHPECRIVTHRQRISWEENSLDFSHEKVREHYLGFIRELFERFDMDGLELDWMRFGYCLPYGKAKASRSIITEFIGRVRDLSRICSDRTGRNVRIGVRVPPEIQTCLSMGYDVIEWIGAGLVDQVTIANFLSDHWLDFPVETWKAVIGKKPVVLGVCLYLGITDPNTGSWFYDNADIYRGSAGAALVRGADRIYLFNTCYYEHHKELKRDDMLNDILTTCGSPKTIAGKGRRHILTFRQTSAPGEAIWRKIPVPLRKQTLDFISRRNQIIIFQFNLGPTPLENERTFIHLGFDVEANDVLRSAKMWANGSQCAPVDGLPPPEFVTDVAKLFLSWEIDRDALNAGENIVEYNAPDMDGNIVWAEIEMRPE